MMARLLSSAVAGLAVTTTLLLLMQYLIEISEGVETTAPVRGTIEFVRRIKDEQITKRDEKPKRPDRPADPPPLVPPSGEVETGGPTINIWNGLQKPTPTFEGLNGFAVSDNALINIISVHPTYPSAASARGIEGHVLVEFNVTAAGTVSNVVVVESSSKLFNKAAIDAAKRFRYRARIVDGVPQATNGLRKLFRFQMESN